MMSHQSKIPVAGHSKNGSTGTFRGTEALKRFPAPKSTRSGCLIQRTVDKVYGPFVNLMNVISRTARLPITLVGKSHS